MENRKQDLQLYDRKLLKVTGVESVVTFDEKNVLLRLSDGNLLIQGSGMSVSKLNVGSGEVEIEGTVDLMKYQNRKGNFFQRMLK